MIAGLPYDAEIEYLEGTGTQYVDTGIIPFDHRAVVEFQRPSATSKVGYICAAYNINNCRFYPIFTYTEYEGKYFYISKPDNVHLYSKISDTQRHIVDYNSENHYCYFDGNYVGATTAMPSSNLTNSVMLWCIINNGEAQNISETRIFSVKLFDRIYNTLVCDLIPVRVGQVGYMYDRVTRKLFGNAGTGAFVLGPDVATPVMGLRNYPEPEDA